MAAFGDKCDLCGRNDFLPIRCDLCGFLLCTEHRPAQAHACKGQFDNVQSDRPREVGLGAALASHMAEVAARFEGREWSTKEHFRIRGSAAEAEEEKGRRENRFLKAYRERARRQGGMSEKQRRMSDQVRRMLVKSKGVGRKDLQGDERVYLEVRFGGIIMAQEEEATEAPSSEKASSSENGEEGEEVVDYCFFSRLRTAGRVLDELVSRHHGALQRTYPGWTGDYGLASERAGGAWLPLSVPLGEMGPSLLQSCDVVTLLPYTHTTPAVAEEGEGEGEEEGQRQQHGAGGTVGEGTSTGPCNGPSTGTWKGPSDPSEGPPPAPSCVPSEPPPSAPPAAPCEGQACEGQGQGEEVVVSVVAGRAAHSIAFPLAQWDGGATVGDLKARIEAATGMKASKQKLLFKGVLSDAAQALRDTKLKHGSKITLMTASK